MQWARLIRPQNTRSLNVRGRLDIFKRDVQLSRGQIKPIKPNRRPPCANVLAHFSGSPEDPTELGLQH